MQDLIEFPGDEYVNEEACNCGDDHPCGDECKCKHKWKKDVDNED